MPRNSGQLAWLAALCAAGLALRCWGLRFGMPLVSNFYVRPDESLIVVAAARLFELQGHPGFFAYPAFMVELCAVLFRAVPGGFGANPSAYFLVARCVSVFCGTLTIAVVWAIARRLSSERGALLAAGLFACAPLAVRDAHSGVTDTLLTLLLAASGLFAMRYVEAQPRNARRELSTAAVLFGLAISTKYTALLLLPVLLLGVAWKRRATVRLMLRDAALLLAPPAVLFVLLNPYVFLCARDSMGTVYTILDVFYRHQPGDSTWNPGAAWSRVLAPLRHGPGAVPGLLAGAAAVFCLRKTDGAAPILVFAVLAPLAFAAALLPFQHGVPYRYLLPAMPWLAVLAGYVAERAARRIAWTGAFPCLVFLLIAPALYQCVLLDVLLAREDTRTLAGQWVVRNLNPATPVVLLGGPECEPQIPETRDSIGRRIEYVYRLYGPHSGDIVAQLYRLQLASPGAAPWPQFEAIRNPEPAAVSPPTVLVAVPSYPLAMVGQGPAPLAAYGGRRQLVAAFRGLEDGALVPELDPIDAFFLPFSHLTRVLRPGPNLELWLVHRD